IIADNKIDELKTRYPVPFIEKGIKFRDFMSIESEAAVAIESGISAMHDVSTGGILGALWEFAEASNAGLTIDLKKIPIRQETVEICEFFELNPYSLMSQGSLLIASANAKKVVNALESNGISAQIIGKFVEGKGRVIYNEEESRYLDKPYEDEIYKIKF
ncbi:MAG: hydrogenase maturation factor, partial [Butyrivibrio sp.]|nr:hydrogenase maturation factor [Butyrivibrio sp.]